MIDNIQGNMMTANEQGDQYEPEYDSGEDSSSLNRMRIVILGPVQLAPKHCDCSRCKWRGDEKPCVQKYVTMNEMNKHYKDRLVRETLDLEAQTLAIIGHMQSDFRAAMKVKDEEAMLLLSQHNTFMDSLPKESRAGKERRLQQKQKDLLEKLSSRSVRKVGFKKRVIKDTPIEVVTARRALRRKESRDNKKKEEVERAANFTVEASTVEVSTVASVEASTVESVEASTVESVEASATEIAKSVEVSAAEIASSVEAVVASATETAEVWQEVKKPPAKKSVGLPKPTRKLACTQMCRSVGTTVPCSHGSSCRFAHGTSELDCMNVVRQASGVYKNKDHIHPGETNERLCNSADIKSDMLRVKTTAKTVCSSLEDELVIRVPKDLALQAMEIAMKLGKTNIRIEIV